MFFATVVSGALLMCARQSNASFVPMQMTVIHGAEEAYNASPPAASINTIDADNNGVIASLSPNLISLETRSASIPPGVNPPSFRVNSGELRFSATEPFSLGGEVLSIWRIPGFFVQVLNSDTNMAWRYESQAGFGVVRGDLASPAPAGEYRMTWGHSPMQMQSSYSAADVSVTLAVVPEPSAMGLIFLANGRRRRLECP